MLVESVEEFQGATLHHEVFAMATLAKTVIATVVCLLIFSTTATAVGFARPGRGEKNKKPKRQRFMHTGTIEALLPGGVIKFTLGTKDTWHVKLAAPKRHRDKKTGRYFFKGGTEVEVTGRAQPDFLRSGMYVRYSAGFNAKGKSSDKIDLVTIFTPNKIRKVGVFREGFVEKEGGNKAGAITQFLVCGQLASFKNGKMTVVVNGKKVRVDVAKDVKIMVDVSDPSLVKKGDKIEVRGYYFKKGTVFGESVKIELSEPLGGAKKKSKKPKKPKKPKRFASKKPRSQKE